MMTVNTQKHGLPVSTLLLTPLAASLSKDTSVDCHIAD